MFQTWRLVCLVHGCVHVICMHLHIPFLVLESSKTRLHSRVAAWFQRDTAIIEVMAFASIRVAIVLCLLRCITSLQFGPFSFANKKQSQSKISDIINKLESTNSGLITSSNPEIISSIDLLRSAPFVEKRDGKLVDGFWELLWTTEKVFIFRCSC